MTKIPYFDYDIEDARRRHAEARAAYTDALVAGEPADVSPIELDVDETRLLGETLSDASRPRFERVLDAWAQSLRTDGSITPEECRMLRDVASTRRVSRRDAPTLFGAVYVMVHRDFAGADADDDDAMSEMRDWQELMEHIARQFGDAGDMPGSKEFFDAADRVRNRIEPLDAVPSIDRAPLQLRIELTDDGLRPLMLGVTRPTMVSRFDADLGDHLETLDDDSAPRIDVLTLFAFKRTRLVTSQAQARAVVVASNAIADRADAQFDPERAAAWRNIAEAVSRRFPQ